MVSTTIQLLEGMTLNSRIIPSSYGSGHAHAAYEIGMLAGGKARAFYRGAYQALQDELIVFDSGEPHAGYLIGEAGWLRRTFLYIEPCALRCVGSAVADKPISAFHFPKLGAPDLLKPFISLFTELQQGVSTLEAQAQTVDALSLLLERHADIDVRPRPIGHEPHAVREVKAYLAANLNKNVSLETLGSVTQMNWDYLRKAFRAHVGVPPHRYQTLLRLERAKVLILKGIPISQAALEVGFADQAHLTRAFRRYLEFTPSLLNSPSPSLNVQNVQDARR